MSPKIVLISACGVLVLVGCAATQFSAPRAGEGSRTAALDPGCHSARQKCVIAVKADVSKACGFAFDPDPLKVKRSFKDFVVVWRLPSGYEFRDGADVGDGVKFAKEPPNGEFQNGYATDDDEGGPPSVGIVSKRRFRWVYRNTID